MASTIPDIAPSYASLGNLPTPVSERPIVTADTSQVAKATADAAGVVKDQAIETYNEEGKLQYEYAKSNYTTALIEAQKEEENNPDWKGAPDRWKKASETAFAMAQKDIQHPLYRAQFGADAKLDTERQYSSFLQNVDVKRKQDGLGKTMQAGDNNMAAALAATDDATAGSIIQNTQNIYRGATNSGFWTPAQELEARNKWIKEYGQNKIEQFIQNGNPQGAQDWFNKHYNLLNPSTEQTNQVNSSVAIPRAQALTDKIVNGASIANSNALTEARRQVESANRQLDKDGNPVLGPMLKDGQQAVGISQILPSTARDVAAKMNVPFDLEKLKYDKEYNQMLGDAYQNEMIARYHGNQTLAMAAYNAGPANVDGWIQRFGDPNMGEISDKDFAEKIPFKETRNYVAMINDKVPMIPGVPHDHLDTAKRNDAWLSAAEQLPDAIAPMAKAGIQARIDDGIQQTITQQTNAAATLVTPVLNGKLTDPAQLSSSPEVQTAWAVASPDLQKAVLAGMGDRNKDTKEYGDKFWDLFKAVHAADNDPARITDPTQLYKFAAGNGLTLAGLDRLTKEIEGKGSPEGEAESAMKKQFFTNAKGQISGADEGLHIKDPRGEELYLKFMAHALTDYDAGRKAGKSPAALLNPESADYIGKSISTFKRPMNQWVADMMQDSSAPQERTLNDIIREAQGTKDLTKKAALKAEAIKLGFVRDDALQVPRPE